MNKVTDSYERLEFLGDAVLDYLVSCFIFSSFPEKTPGEVTELRSALVCNNTLASLTVKAGLHAHILHHSDRVSHRKNYSSSFCTMK
jgi:endoribonuclease Dicer